MCLAVPGKLLSKENIGGVQVGQVQFGGITRQVALGFVPEVEVGDYVMVHVGYHAPTIVGDYCSITHRVVLHGCTSGDNCQIGIGATVMEGVTIGETSIVAGHTFVADNTVIPPNSIVMGTPAKVVRSKNNFVGNKLNAMLYYRNALAYARGHHRAWDGPEHEAQMAAWQAEIEREFAARYGR